MIRSNTNDMQKMIDGCVRIYTPDGKCNISGERIKEARQRRGLTQEGLSVKLQLLGLQVGQMAISRMETGKRLMPDFELPLLANALGVTTGWLLGREDSQDRGSANL